MKTYFTADTHFGHTNIIKYCNRPFADTEEMDRTLVTNWNARVQPGDTIYHLGDFSMSSGGPALKYLKQLNGTIHLVVGNHEKEALAIRNHFASVNHLLEVAVDGQRMVLCHYAMRVWNKSHHGAWHLYGHSHGTLPDDINSLSVDVGVDCWGYYPVSMNQLKQAMSHKTPKVLDHHGRPDRFDAKPWAKDDFVPAKVDSVTGELQRPNPS